MMSSQVIWEMEPLARIVEDDLLTGGLGLQGLRNPSLPEGATARLAALHKNFRDLVELSPGGGFEASVKGGAAGLIVPGTEYGALLGLPGCRQAISVRVLVPQHFDWDRPLMVVAPSSGSRGVTGAIGDVGSWALPEGCALVLTDKGTGGAQILDENTCFDPDLVATTELGAPTSFRLEPTIALSRFREANPGAIALQHAHSQDNIEAHWPSAVLAAASYGLDVLKKQEGLRQPKLTLDRIKVIAAGVSNGGGAVLRAAENDELRILDAVVAVEPNITPRNNYGGRVRLGNGADTSPGRTLVDYATAMNVLLPAALCAPALANDPFAEVTAAGEARQADWAGSLAKLGLLDGRNTAERATSALDKIRALGFAPQSEPLLHMMSVMHIWPAVAHTFVNALGKFPVEADPIGAHITFADTDVLGQTLERTSLATPEQRRLYGALSGGLSPGGGAFTVYKDGDIHPTLDDALALRRIATGRGGDGHKVSAGMTEIRASARSRGHPTIVLHGRCDSLINVEHTSRAYFAAAMNSDTDTRNWRYYEHDTGQHFESLLMVPGLSQRFNPLLPSFFQSLQFMRQHLFQAAPLPPSQVLRAALPKETGDDGLAIRSELSSGSIRTDANENRIAFNGNVLVIPE